MKKAFDRALKLGRKRAAKYAAGSAGIGAIAYYYAESATDGSGWTVAGLIEGIDPLMLGMIAALAVLAGLGIGIMKIAGKARKQK